ncbi:MAG: dethiobiotin synthase [Proteobacteria bacterium]|nr:dethiobiotin synthase [Pseudomonadota bacterium]
MIHESHNRIFIAGTDTEVGKTFVSAWLCNQLKAEYWKPIQTGSINGTDSELIREVGGINTHRESYCYKAPVSPHLAAQIENEEISLESILVPSNKCLITEGAGGVLTPINSKYLMIDLIKQLSMPVILVARTTLGTINHTLLSLEAFRARNVKVLGIIMNGTANADNRSAIEHYGRIKVLAEMPMIGSLTAPRLQRLELPILLKQTVENLHDC